MSFHQRLMEAASSRGRLCVGIDPHPELLEQWALQDDIEGLSTFASICVDAFGDLVSLVKPQVAFFERFGARGYAVLEDTIAGLRGSGALVLSDAKRGDIGTTMKGYAQAWLDPLSPLASDAVTVSPYLGVSSLHATIETAAAHDAGVFVLAATSNPEARALQDRRGPDGRSITQLVIDELVALDAPGTAGIVVGATLADPPDLTAFSGPVLLPGLGAQGGTAKDVQRLMAGDARRAFPNASRSILNAGPDVADLRKEVISVNKAFQWEP